MARRSDGQLSDREIVDYLNKRAFVECTDSGYEDPNRFTTEMYPGDFRHAISLHITRVKSGGVLQPLPLPPGTKSIPLDEIGKTPTPDDNG